jgi:hypothetical protein
MTALINLIIFNLIFAILSAAVGHFRSGNGSAGFLLGMVVGPFGLMLIAFSPTYRRGAPAPVQPSFTSRPSPPAGSISPWIAYGVLLAVAAAFAGAIYWVGP